MGQTVTVTTAGTNVLAEVERPRITPVASEPKPNTVVMVVAEDLPMPPEGSRLTSNKRPRYGVWDFLVKYCGDIDGTQSDRGQTPTPPASVDNEAERDDEPTVAYEATGNSRGEKVLKRSDLGGSEWFAIG